MRDEPTAKTPRQKSKWEPMELSYVGHVAEILRFGSGKLSLTGGDPGDPKKPKGGE